MIITQKIRISRVISGTWKNLIFIGFGCVIAYLFNEYLLKYYFEFPAIVDAILGPALAFFIGFNNNQAYDRWWEGRKIWGALVNDSRTWARQLIWQTSVTDSMDEGELRELRKRVIYRHIGFLYALKEDLRGETNNEHRKYLPREEIDVVELESNTQNAILTQQSRELEHLYKRGWIDGFKFIELNKIIVRFCDEMGKAERIKNTVFPTTYHYYTRLFIWFLIISITFVISNSIGPWSILFGALIGYVFMTTHMIGQVILNPFEPVPSGLPLDQITRTIEINLLEALREAEIPQPVKSVNDEYIM